MKKYLNSKDILKDNDLSTLSGMFFGFWFHWASGSDSLLSDIILYGIAIIIFFLSFRVIKRIFFDKKTTAHKNSV